MRRYLLSTILLVSLPLASHAQNYIPNNGYGSAGVLVNMDVLNASAPSLGGATVMSQDLMPVAPPMMLRPPQSAIVPVMPAPVAMAPNPIMDQPISKPVYSGKRQVLGSVHDSVSDELASLPATPPALPSPIMGSTDVIQGSAPAATANNFEAYRLFFDASSDVLKPSETSVLNKIIAKLNTDPSLRLQVRAYANGTADNAGAARRLSLSRALKVRDYMTQQNIPATRLDIRALGSGSMEMGDQASSNAPADRVDVVFSK